MNINEPARRSPEGDPLIFAVRPRFDILRRLAPGETGWCAERSVDGVTYESIWLKAAMVFPRHPGDRILNHLVRVEKADAILRQPYALGEALTRAALGATVVGSRQNGDWTPWAACWFSHKTFRFGRSDSQLLGSFERFIREAQRHNRSFPEIGPGRIELMGAEDRWRWELCDCAECAAGPTVAINH